MVVELETGSRKKIGSRKNAHHFFRYNMREQSKVSGSLFTVLPILYWFYCIAFVLNDDIGAIIKIDCVFSEIKIQTFGHTSEQSFEQSFEPSFWVKL